MERPPSNGDVARGRNFREDGGGETKQLFSVFGSNTLHAQRHPFPRKIHLHHLVKKIRDSAHLSELSDFQYSFRKLLRGFVWPMLRHHYLLCKLRYQSGWDWWNAAG